MGGMIAQTLACRHPDRVRSLTSLSSTPATAIGRPHPRILALLGTWPARTRDDSARVLTHVFRVIGSPGYPRDERWIAEVARQSFDRGHDPDGVRRQLAAILAAPDRRPMLHRLRLPVLVVHGGADPLIRPPGGRATAAVIAGAKLVVYPGMGHDLPASLQPAIAEEILDVSRLWSPAPGRGET